MRDILLVYGNESQLVEEEKQKFLLAHSDLDVRLLSDEVGPARISEELMEDSLFGDAKVFCLINPPIFKKSGQKDNEQWDALADLLATYDGDNPILIIYHDIIDKRLKQNKTLLDALPHRECKRLEGADLLMWIRQYCTSHGYTLTPNGHDYLSNLLELWKDVPVAFMRTEFDRYFLLLGEEKEIDQPFLMEHSSNYGAKNIYAFKEALLNRDINTLLELFPFMMNYKEVDYAMSYIEGQLRLQLLVSEGRAAGMNRNDIEQFCKNHDSSFKSYPIKLAYEASSRISLKALRMLLKGLYDIMVDSRTGQGDMLRFRDLCVTYCGYKG